mmetsp:Transcript_36036/g.84691  ORF Transcript_36036/g.84691 Transcript_36036/m.84691 type:complete len:217 (+) Transcript_36036:269-919(+)
MAEDSADGPRWLRLASGDAGGEAGTPAPLARLRRNTWGGAGPSCPSFAAASPAAIASGFSCVLFPRCRPLTGLTLREDWGLMTLALTARTRAAPNALPLFQRPFKFLLLPVFCRSTPESDICEPSSALCLRCRRPRSSDTLGAPASVPALKLPSMLWLISSDSSSSRFANGSMPCNCSILQIALHLCVEKNFWIPFNPMLPVPNPSPSTEWICGSV